MAESLSKSIVTSTNIMPMVMPQITNWKLNDTNYQQWSKAVKIYLTGLGKQRYLTDDSPTEDSKKLMWIQEDAQILGAIWNSMEPRIAYMCSHCETTKEVWDYVRLLYCSNLSRMFDISLEYFQLQQDNKTVTEYFADLKRVSEELNAVMPLSSDIKVMQRQREQMLVLKFLAGLKPEFEPIKSQILAGEQLPSFAEAYARVLRSASKDNAQGDGPSSLLPELSGSPDSTTRLSHPNLQVYSRRSMVEKAPDMLRTSPINSQSSDPGMTPSCESDLPIALRKGKRHCTSHPISNFVSYSRLSLSYSSFVASLDSVSIPKSITHALNDPGWRLAMQEEMLALEKNGTWDLVPRPSGKPVVGCKWVYTIKVQPNGSIDRLKARLVARGFTQVYGVDYLETFSPVAKITSVRLLISLAATYNWPLHQLDVKNAFLHGDLEEEVYMEQPPGFVVQGENSQLVCCLKKSLYGLKQSPRAWFGRFSSVVMEFGLTRCGVDHSVFYGHSNAGKILLVVYVDDIVITGDDVVGIQKLKSNLQANFQTKDLGHLQYFLGIEVARSKYGIYLCQRKYVLDMLSEVGMLGCRPVDTPMDPNVKLARDQGALLDDPKQYRKLVGILRVLLEKGCYIKIMDTLILKDIVMQIGPVLPQIEDRPQDIVCLLVVI
ncbi:uncharacterized protein [Coffea arabica]|uniref:Reverse transcriptase Ty1/copia-type domain-containing protein n=1 Tax=Coffea arabica TaxID=13443 RepID=A0ABM4V8X8_COFAR